MTIKEWRDLIDYAEAQIRTDARFPYKEKAEVQVSVEMDWKVGGWNKDDVQVYVKDPRPSGDKPYIVLVVE